MSKDRRKDLSSLKNDINYFLKEHERENPFNEIIENELIESVNVTQEDLKEQQDLKHQRVMIMIQNQWEEKMKQLKIVCLICYFLTTSLNIHEKELV